MPQEWYVTARLGTPAHDRLCDAVLKDAGYIAIGSRLYDVVTWRAHGPDAWRWTLRRVTPARA